MEERVRFCTTCNAVVGWFAMFCEQCGARQQAAEALAVAQAGARGTARPVAAQVAVEPAEISPPPEARTLARDLFRGQLRLIHRHRQQAEDLEGEVGSLGRDVARLDKLTSGTERRLQLDRLSERVLACEHRWEECQRAYNRESEDIEESFRENMESAEIDAYLTPEEQAAVETEYSNLTTKLDALDAAMRAAGTELAQARSRYESRYFGLPATSHTAAYVSLGLALLGVAATGLLVRDRAEGLRIPDLLVCLTPATAGILVLFALARLRR